jgi:hypothetical protein
MWDGMEGSRKGKIYLLKTHHASSLKLKAKKKSTAWNSD